MTWIVCKFKNGSNPYIIKTEKELKKIEKKYKNKINKISNTYFFIED